jgi:hypothetical protein
LTPVKIVSCVGLFLVVVFGGDRIVAFSAERVIHRSHNQFVRMYEGKYPADILFLGNSRVDRNIAFEKVHDLTGKTCLNLGLGGNNMLISEALLKDFVERYGNPKLLVLELSHSTVRTDSMGEIGLFSYCSPNINALAKTINPTYTAFESIFISLRFNSPSFWRLSTEAFTEPQSRLLHNTIPPEVLKEWQNGAPVEMPIIVQNMDALSRICAYADAKNIPTRLLIAPYWKDFRKRIVNFEPWKARLQEAAGQYPIYDYSEAFSEHVALFNDEMHLNAAGANEFSQRLVADKVL